MITYLKVLASLEGFWFICLFVFALYGVYTEKQNKKRFNFTYWECFKKIFTDGDLIEFYFIGVFIVFILSFPATWFVFIFNLFEKLIR